MSIDSQLLNLTGGIKTSGHIKSNFGATIGVGTDAPTGVVEVQHSQPTLVVQQQATSGGSVTSYGKVHAASGTLHIQSGVDATSDSKGDIVLGSVGSGTKHVVVKGATSRVGIGSDAPAYGLDVVPESRFTGNVIASNISTNVLTLNELTLGVTQGLDNVVNVDNTTSNTIAMSNVDESTSTTTGALTVAGGIGVGGNVHCANLYASNITMVRKLELQDGGLGLKLGSNVSVSGTPSAVIQKITGPHARESAVLKRYPEMKMGGLDNQTKAGVTVSSSSTAFNNTGFYNSNVYNQIINDEGWHTTGVPSSVSGSAYTIGGVTGEWHKTEFPNKLKVQSFHIAARYGFETTQAPEDLTILGSNDDSTWVSLKSVTGLTYTAYKYTPVHIDATEYYKYLAVVVTDTVDGTSACTIGEMYWMAREYVGAGDDSVDTTVKSVFNAPDLTSAALYIDAAKTGTSVTDQSGSTPSVTVTATGVTYDSSEKAWTLTGAATSNIVSGDLASLVGDHPHSVSAWVKADQLNGDGLFHVGTAEGEGDAASRVGFVDDSHISWGGEDHYFSNAEWHNVTYTYNGEGSDKKLYLDGRLVDTAKNEDTFGDYPPFAMTNYSEYGYTVSASSELAGGGYLAWEAFDNTTGGTSGGGGAADQAWISANSTYTGSTYHSTKNLGTDHGGSATTSGEYLILELPHKLILSYVEISPRGSDADRAPRDGKVYGSNDKVNWTEIGSFTGLAHSSGSYASVVVNANSGFKMFAIVTTAILNSVTSTWLGIGELKYYGHRENDLVRFPDPTNVLKYPHVAMTGPAQRGYVVSGSTHAFIPSSDSRDDPWRAFEGSTDVQNWKTHEMYTTAGVYSPATYSRTASSITDTGSTQHSGEYLVLETPRKITLSSWEVKAAYAPRRIVDYAILGSDTNSSSANKTGWTLLTNGTFAAQETVTATVSSPTTAFKYHAIVVKSVTNHSDSRRAQIDEMKLYGTEPEDVVARVGDGFDGKVRNVRVYSTALSDARVQEIFDADKDEFELAKSSISVYRGHLGIGESEPKGALTVMDEVAELEEFPPRAMSNYETFMEGHGVFKASASEEYSQTIAGNASGDEAWLNFDKTRSNWTGGNSYTGTNNTYAGAHTSGGYGGDYIELKLPYKIRLQQFIIQPSAGLLNRWSKSGVVVAKNANHDTWTNIFSWSGSSVSSVDAYSPVYFRGVDATNAYDTFRLVITSVDSQPYVTLWQWRLFGTREQGASTLHNGELSLTRNLTVPRIGPPLDADDTPRRDRLVVEYNTSTNPTENGVVKDTSGRGLDGLTYNGASYSATEKALVFDGTDDYLAADNIHNPAGAWAHSYSFWVKFNATSVELMVMFGKESTSKASTLRLNTANEIIWFFYGGSAYGDTKYSCNVSTGRWYHISAVYDGNTGKEVYIDGVRLTETLSSSASANYDANSPLFIGTRESKHQWMDGSISNFKLYDVALTADEVKRLYDMGRCDEGNHTTVVSRSKLQMRGEQLILEPCIKGFYEEGTWTPIIYGSLGGEKTPTTSNYGWFVRVGNMVTIGGTISWSGGSTMVGQVRLKTLPYVSRATPNTNRSAISFGVTASGIITGSGFNTIRLVIDPGTNFIYVIQSNEYRSTTVTYSHYPGIASSGNIYGIGGSYMI